MTIANGYEAGVAANYLAMIPAKSMLGLELSKPYMHEVIMQLDVVPMY